MTRTDSAIRNATVGIVVQLVSLVIAFGMSSLFVRTLGGDYLGANSLFTTVVAILSFSELGLGSAVAFSLYQPLNDGDKPRVAAIMKFFERVYKIVATVIFVLSLVSLPFIPYFIHGSSIPNIRLYFFLFTLNTVVSYTMSSKRTLFIADQKGYINNLNTLYAKIFVTLIQVAILLLHSYIGFLLIQILGTIVSNILITKRANRDYKDIFAIESKISKKDLSIIRKSTLGLIGQTIGTIIVRDSNSLVISAYVGLFMTGVYSSYMMILNAIEQLIGQALNSIVSGLGNLGAERNKNKMFEWLKRHAFLTWTIGYFSFVYIMSLATPVVQLWLGQQYELPRNIVFILSLNFYISRTRTTYLSFIQAQGLFTKVGLKSVIEAVINLILTLFMAAYFGLGIFGVVLSTTVVHIFLNIWYEPWVVYKFGFHEVLPPKYFFEYYIKLVFTIAVGMSCSLLVGRFTTGTFVSLLSQFGMTTLFSSFFYLLVTFKNEFLKFYINIFLKKLGGKGRDFNYRDTE